MVHCRPSISSTSRWRVGSEDLAWELQRVFMHASRVCSHIPRVTLMSQDFLKRAEAPVVIHACLEGSSSGHEADEILTLLASRSLEARFIRIEIGRKQIPQLPAFFQGQVPGAGLTEGVGGSRLHALFLKHFNNPWGSRHFPSASPNLQCRDPFKPPICSPGMDS